MASPVPLSAAEALRERALALVGKDRLLAAVLLDLDERLHFAATTLVLSECELIAVSGAGTQRWPINDDLVLETTDMVTTGAITLRLAGREQHTWRFTAGKLREVETLITRLIEQRAGILGDEVEEIDNVLSSPQIGFGGPLLRLVQFARPWAWLMALGLALAAMATAADLLVPWLSKSLIDEVLIPLKSVGREVAMQKVQIFAMSLAGAAFLTWILSWAKTYSISRLAECVTSRIRRETYNHLQRLSLSYFNKKRTGDLISRIANDTDSLSYFVSVSLIEFISDVLLFIGTACLVWNLNPTLALAALGPLPLVAWLVGKVRTRLRGGFAAAARALSMVTSVLSDTIPGVRVVKAFAQEQREMDRFRAADQHMFDTNDRVNRTWSFFAPTIGLMTSLGLMIVWVVGAGNVADAHITVGELTAVVFYIQRFYGRVESMSKFLAAVQRAAACAHRLFELLDVKADMSVSEGMKHCGRLQGELEFRDVRFRHGSREVIKGINLRIAPGEMIGLVGPSGAGKTTLVNLACRFFDVSDGVILVDGMDLRELNVEDYRRNLGLVLQEPYLFFGTIAENIAYGKPHATRAEIVSAARAARAHDFIMRQSDGYDSMVGERGQQLSGGERQRISIARALLVDPALLILDEATSAVDTETELEIQAALDHLVKGRTTIAIAHRLGTLRMADRLIVMEDGAIVETGSHDDLLQHSGTYARLYEAMMEVNRR